MRHHGAHDDSDEHTSENEEHSEVTNVWQEPVHEEHDAAAEPRAKKEGDKSIPCRRGEVGVGHHIHGHRLLSHDQRHRGGTKSPRETVPPSCEETTHATVLASGDRGPVVDTTR